MKDKLIIEFKVYNALLADLLEETISKNKHTIVWGEALAEKIIVSKTKIETYIDLLTE